MEEKLNETKAEYTNFAETEIPSENATIQETADENSAITVPIKFNKEIKNLSLDEAQQLAQKGMKYDLISADFARLKALATAEGKNVSDYITAIEGRTKAARKESLLEKVGGDEQMAEHIMSLEQSQQSSTDGMEEVRKDFPEIKTPSDLPAEVQNIVKEKGGNYFDEYLKYLHRQAKKSENAKQKQAKSQRMSAGSQSRFIGDGMSAVKQEFINGLWS